MKTRYLDIDDRTEDLRELMRDQPREAIQEFQARFDCSLLYHENALEGVVFSGQELLVALNLGAAPSDATSVSVFTRIRRHKEALDYVRQEAKAKKSTLTLNVVKRIHELLSMGMSTHERPIFRQDMPVHRAYFHDIIIPGKIADALARLLDATTTSEFRESHPVHQAAWVQWHFMQAFPFTDHNGRVARLLSHMVLMRQNYLPAIIHVSERQRYYESFRLPMSNLQLILTEAMENSLENAFKFFDQEITLSRASNE